MGCSHYNINRRLLTDKQVVKYKQVNFKYNINIYNDFRYRNLDITDRCKCDGEKNIKILVFIKFLKRN